MNIYSDSMYTEVQEYYAEDNIVSAVYNKKSKKNARRAQRKAKQAQRDRYYDTF